MNIRDISFLFFFSISTSCCSASTDDLYIVGGIGATSLAWGAYNYYQYKNTERELDALIF